MKILATDSQDNLIVRAGSILILFVTSPLFFSARLIKLSTATAMNMKL